MKKLIALTIVGLSLGMASSLAVSTAHAQADCVVNTPPNVPDGKTAGEAEMVEAQQAIRSYVAETQEYLSCLENASRGRLGGDWTRRYNEASSQMEKLASDFNRQLRAFKSR